MKRRSFNITSITSGLLLVVFILWFIFRGIPKLSRCFLTGSGSIEERLKGPLAQDDSRVVDFILSKNYIQRPADSNIPYNLKEPEVTEQSMGQSSVVKDIFDRSNGGFFIECGALDGETRSNTLSLERDFGWKGLLIEGDPSNFNLLLTKKRKAWAANCCLAIHPYPHEVTYVQDFNTGKIKEDLGTEFKAPLAEPETVMSTTTRVQCFPIFSILLAINVTTVDYFSLDVEGNELQVLQSIPFESIYIKVFSVEYTHTFTGPNSLEKFMKEKGYRVLTKVTNDRSLANDFIFVHHSVKVNKRFPKIINTP